MKLTNVWLKGAGQIKEITAIGHQSYKGVAAWHYVGAVEWEVGKSSEVEIAPYNLCYGDDEKVGHQEINELGMKLNDYLAEEGTWHDGKMKNGMMVHWTPKKPNGKKSI